MAFKTAAEIFGDGGGWGTQVNISLTAPTGVYAATNRGIGFGEVLSSAIANRTAYALGLNADDLNTRLALWETGGLDAGYRLGAAAVAGGGREIVKDGGAVETISSLATQYLDDHANAHFRANALGDSTSGGGGFDFRGKYGAAASAYGFLSRQNTSPANGYTGIAASAAATLNPGGIGGDIIRFGPDVHDGTFTDVTYGGPDFLEVEVGGAVVGIYALYSAGASNKDWHVRTLSGVAPAFTSGTAATVRFFVADATSSATMGWGATSAGLAAAAKPSDDTALALFARDFEVGTNGGDAIHFISTLPTGVVQTAARFTALGRLLSSITATNYGDVSLLGARYTERLEAGIPAISIDKSAGTGGYHEVGVLVSETGAAADSWAALESRELTLYAADGISASINGTFTTPEGRVILPDSDGTPAAPTGQTKTGWAARVQPGVTLVKILTASNPGYVGRHYLLSEVNLTAAGAVADEMTLTNLDGTALGVGDLPTSTNFTFQFVQRSVVGGKLPPVTVDSGADSSGITLPADITAATVLCAPQETAGDVTGLAAAVFRGQLFGIRSDDLPAVSTDVHSDVLWMIQETGDFSTYGKVRARGDVSAGYGAVSSAGFVIRTTHANAEFKYATARSRTVVLPISTAHPHAITATTPQWVLLDSGSGPYWKSLVNSGDLYLPLNGVLRSGMDITAIHIMGLGDVASGVPLYFDLITRTPNWGTPGFATETIVATTSATPIGTAMSVGVNNYGVAAQGIDLSTTEWYVKITAGNAGAASPDTIVAAKIVVDDYGPRNF
jgi:hypothetical protein